VTRPLAAAVALVTAAAFLPTLGNDFVSWDDPTTLLDNPHYRGFGWDNLRWMFTSYHLGHYLPVTWLTFALDYVLWGMHPAGYHLTALVIHVAGVVTFFFVARRLIAGPPDARLAGAAAAALLFAVHPLRVESVAWATERRDVLAGLFYVLTILVWLRALDAPAGSSASRRRYWGAVALFGAAVLSKSMAVSLPFVLLVLDVYPLRRLPGPRAVWVEKLPFAVVAAAASANALAALASVKDSGNVLQIAVLERLTLAERFALMCQSLVFYIRKTVAPVELSALYELPAVIVPLSARFVVPAIAVGAITAATIAVRRRWPGALAVWSVYTVSLVPVSGLMQNGPQFAADRYSYVTMLGFALLAGGGVAALWAARPHARTAIVAVGSLVVLTLATLTWRQTMTWRDSATLWEHAVAVAPSAIGHANLADLAAGARRFDDVERHARAAIAINPEFAIAHNELAVALEARGDREGAIRHLRETVRINPGLAPAHTNLAALYMDGGRWAEALPHLEAAARLTPGDADVARDLAAVRRKLSAPRRPE
jgi:tetratricopeptide (TPR) repeat protein